MNSLTKTKQKPELTNAHAADAEIMQFAQDVRDSLRQAANGEFARVTTPEQMQARKVGRPLGSTKANPKQVVKIRLDPDVLAGLRGTGRGWQTQVNDAMRAWLTMRTAA
jgi:uncharacterized protein (DUF4415 family)